jgi:hypothetical protein
MRRLTEAEIKELRSEGITHLATVVKGWYFTKYWHVVSLDRIEKNNRYWIPAPIVTFPSGATCRAGVTEKSIDWTKTVALSRVYYTRKNGGARS